MDYALQLPTCFSAMLVLCYVCVYVSLLVKYFKCQSSFLIVSDKSGEAMYFSTLTVYGVCRPPAAEPAHSPVWHAASWLPCSWPRWFCQAAQSWWVPVILSYTTGDCLVLYCYWRRVCELQSKCCRDARLPDRYSADRLFPPISTASSSCSAAH